MLTVFFLLIHYKIKKDAYRARARSLPSANRVLFLLEGVSRAPGKAVKVKGTRLVVTGEPQQLGCPVLRRDTDDQVNVDVPVLELASVIKLSESLYLYNEFYH